MPGRIAATLRVLHGGPRFLRDFDMLGLAEGYRAVDRAPGLPDAARATGLGGPPSGRSARRWRRIPLPTRAVPQRPPGRQLHRAGRTGSAWWTGSTAATATRRSSSGTRAASSTTTTRGCGSSAGRTSAGAPAALVARVRLHMIVSDVGWTLWAAIQTAISRIAFDFAAYGAARWTRAEAAMDSAGFPALAGRRRAPARAAASVSARGRVAPLTTSPPVTHRRPSPRGPAPNPRRDA